jgi:hypothetical protein
MRYSGDTIVPCANNGKSMRDRAPICQRASAQQEESDTAKAKFRAGQCESKFQGPPCIEWSSQIITRLARNAETLEVKSAERRGNSANRKAKRAKQGMAIKEVIRTGTL